MKKLIILTILIILGILILVYEPIKNNNYIGDSSTMEVYSVDSYIECNAYIKKSNMMQFNELEEALDQGYSLVENCQ